MLTNQDFLSITQPTKQDIETILRLAAEYDAGKFHPDTLRGKVIGSLFFETSTRTRLSFETAVQRLGGSIVGFAGSESTSMHTKGESFEDTIRVIAGYVDAIVIRHPDAGSAKIAADIAQVPVINAGDGPNEHPSQTLYDLYSIQKTQGSLDNLTIAMVGDLKYSRVAHSLAKALMHWPSTKQIWVAPAELRMPSDIKTLVDNTGITINETEDLESSIPEADIILMTRVQVERFTDPAVYERLKDVYVLRNSMLTSAKSTMKIISPLPRREELPIEIDSSPHAYYFQQAAHGVPVRMALLSALLGK